MACRHLSVDGLSPLRRQRVALKPARIPATRGSGRLTFRGQATMILRINPVSSCVYAMHLPSGPCGPTVRMRCVAADVPRLWLGLPRLWRGLGGLPLRSTPYTDNTDYVRYLVVFCYAMHSPLGPYGLSRRGACPPRCETFLLALLVVARSFEEPLPDPPL